MRSLQRRAVAVAAHAMFLFIICLITLAAGELYLRNFVFDPFAYYTWTPGLHIVFAPDPRSMPGATEPADFLINRYGLRGDLPDSRQRILAVGGSTTEDVFLTLQHSWTHQLQDRLPDTWVGNMGKAGTNSTHHALALEKTLSRLPKMDEIIVLVGLNDMLFDLGLHRPDGLGADWDMGQTFAYRPAESGGVLEHLALYHFATNLRRSWHISSEAVRTVDGSFFGAYKKRRSEVAEQDFVNELPEMRPHFAHYRANLERIVAAANGVPVTILTQPCLWHPNMSREELSQLYFGGFGNPDKWDSNPHTKWMSPEALDRALTGYNDTALKFCKDTGTHCIDLARELRRTLRYTTTIATTAMRELPRELFAEVGDGLTG